MRAKNKEELELLIKQVSQYYKFMDYTGLHTEDYQMMVRLMEQAKDSDISEEVIQDLYNTYMLSSKRLYTRREAIGYLKRDFGFLGNRFFITERTKKAYELNVRMMLRWWHYLITEYELDKAIKELEIVYRDYTKSTGKEMCAIVDVRELEELKINGGGRLRNQRFGKSMDIRAVNALLNLLTPMNDYTYKEVFTNKEWQNLKIEGELTYNQKKFKSRQFYKVSDILKRYKEGIKDTEFYRESTMTVWDIYTGLTKWNFLIREVK